MRPMSWLRVASWGALSFAALAAGCGDNGSSPDARVPSDGATDGAPDARITFDTLLETGLCVDAGCATIAADVLPYTPQFALWSDAATKRRWIWLPPSTQIDTTDMDYWKFPVGTKIWKEFTRDGTRVETRLIQKIGPLEDDWFFAPYVWNAAQDTAIAQPLGVVDANGTMHDVPSRAQCKQCHDRAEGDVLGFSAIQLDFAGATGDLDLDDLVTMNLLSAPPAGTTPRFPVPGGADAQAMLGYAHANCGHCHNPTSDVFDQNTNIDLRLRVGLLATADVTPLYTSTIGVDANLTINGAMLRVHAADLTDSVLYQRFISTNPSQHMPKLGSEITDPAGQAIIETWINGLPP